MFAVAKFNSIIHTFILEPIEVHWDLRFMDGFKYKKNAWGFFGRRGGG